MKTFLFAAILTLTMNASANDVAGALNTMRSRSTASAFNTQFAVAPGYLYKALPQTIDWRNGYTTVFAGERLPQIPMRDFMTGMAVHVRTVTRAMAGRGLRGYVFTIVGNREIAFQNWTSKADCDAAFATDAGKDIARQAGSLLKFELFEESRAFADWLNSVR